MREMKDSGIAWVGKIPTHWTKKKGKYILRYMSKPVKQDDSVITCFRDGEVTLRSNRREDGFTMADKEIGYQGVDVGDLVVHGMDGFAGAIGISDSRGKASPVLNVLNTKQNKKYIMYYLRSMAYGEVFTALSTGIRVRSCDLRWNKLAELLYPLPPIDEQNNIVNYIDEQIARTNEIIADTQAQIDTLEQYKRSVITEAVTHGLNPSAPMKECSVSWARQIPQHWKVMPNKHLMTKIKNICPIYKGEDILSLTMYGVIVRDLDAGGKMPSSFDGYQYIKKGNLLMCLFDIDVTPRCIGIIKQNGITSPAYSQFKMKKIANARFYYYYYLMLDYTKELLHLAKNLRHSLTEDQLGAIKQLVPPLDEQQEIADYLDNKCAEIEQIIADKKTQIETLDGYKKSLIYEYVTGKKEVM